MEGWGCGGWKVRAAILLQTTSTGNEKNPRQSAESVQIRDSDNYTIPEESLPRPHAHTQPPTPVFVHTPKPPTGIPTQAESATHAVALLLLRDYQKALETLDPRS